MSKMIRFHNFGKDVLKAEDLEISQPDVRALLVSVHAASVNPVDFKIRCKAWSMAGKEKRSSISSNSRQEFSVVYQRRDYGRPAPKASPTSFG